METKFYRCPKCGQVLTIVNPKCPGVSCCGEPLKELKANTTDAAFEKHVPVVAQEGDVLTVTVGSVEHPMEADHYIEWIYVETEKGGQRKNLLPGEKPCAKFVLCDDKALAVYELCNKHGLWKKELN